MEESCIDHDKMKVALMLEKGSLIPFSLEEMLSEDVRNEFEKINRRNEWMNPERFLAIKDGEKIAEFYEYARGGRQRTNYSYKPWASFVPDVSCNIKKVIFNEPATIVFWTDGSKTVVKATDEPFDKEKGLAMAISKRVLGDKGAYYNVFKKWCK